MLRVPEDLQAQGEDHSARIEDACLIQYEASEPVLSAQALVTLPTFVLVRAGTKQLQPQAQQHLLTVPEGSVLVMRSGTHTMSEFQGACANYKSLVLSVNRSFLRQAVGVPQHTSQGPRVVVSKPGEHAHQLFCALPQALADAQPGVERQFKLRELLVALMGDPEVRQLVFREVVDWGHSTHERIVSVVTAHCLAPLQVPELAALCAMSLSSFKRHFQAVYGTAPGKWLSQVRLEHARSLLLHSDCMVSEICEFSGYRDVSSFIRAFRKKFGVTPTSLRRA